MHLPTKRFSSSFSRLRATVEVHEAHRELKITVPRSGRSTRSLAFKANRIPTTVEARVVEYISQHEGSLSIGLTHSQHLCLYNTCHYWFYLSKLFKEQSLRTTYIWSVVHAMIRKVICGAEHIPTPIHATRHRLNTNIHFILVLVTNHCH
jgi:hypothetical protein